MNLLHLSNSIVVRGSAYTLVFAHDRPLVSLDDARGRRVADLFPLSSVHPLDGRDDTTGIDAWQVVEQIDGIVVSLHAGSTVWKRKTYTFRCYEQRFSYEVTVEGTGRLAEVCLFGGYYSGQPRWGSGFFSSGHHVERLFTPEPNADEVNYLPPAASTTIDLTGVPLPGKRHWFFTPAPFCYALDTGDGWVGLGVEARPGAHRFTAYAYHGGPNSSFHLSLSYEGGTRVDGSYTLPAIGFDFGAREYEMLAAHVIALDEAGYALRRVVRDRPAWWSQPIFCGWGAQCHLAASEHGYRPAGPRDASPAAFIATLRHAGEYATQERYEGFLRSLEDHGIVPGTVVIDDKWQRSYGLNDVDTGKWPDLRGFIARRHAAGQRVLLWLKAWDREGVPDDECVCNGAGLPLTVDPSHPGYQRRLREAVRSLLGSDGYDADGFKIDFTARVPCGPGLRLHGDAWGLELLRLYLQTIYDEAKRVKPDALVMTHTPHPYLADCLDMIRLNDMLDLSRLDHLAGGWDVARTLDLRARVARLACRDALIDTDNWPVLDKATWRTYIGLQQEYGVPSLYTATHVDITGEALDEDDYALVRETWARYRALPWIGQLHPNS